jgi:hypothetical protein
MRETETVRSVLNDLFPVGDIVFLLIFISCHSSCLSQHRDCAGYSSAVTYYIPLLCDCAGYSSAGSSARSSPYTSRANSRPTSAERAGRPSSGYERTGSRPSSVERGRPTNSSDSERRNRKSDLSAGRSSSSQQHASRRQQGSPSSVPSNPSVRGGWANPTRWCELGQTTYRMHD